LIEAVIFDYGGTLVVPSRSFDDEKPNAVRSSYNLLRRNGLTLSYEEYLARNNAVFKRYSEIEKREERDIPDLLKYEEMIGELFPGRPEPWRTKVAQRADDAFWEVVVRNYPIRRETRRTLSRLRSMDLRLGIVSNHHNHGSLVKHLRDLGIAHYFARVISSAEFGTRKPDSRIFLACLSALNVKDPRKAVFVGDSPRNDVEGARSAGLHTILIVDDPPLPVPRGGDKMNTKADYTVHSLSEIPRIIPSL